MISPTSAPKIPFNEEHVVGNESRYVQDALSSNHWEGNGFYTKACEEHLSKLYLDRRPLLTNSCTAALEMAALALNIGPGDEVIMPSWTFASTANAFALRGAVPVFLDVRPDTLAIDESLLFGALTPRTVAICVVHYAGIPAELSVISRFARDHNLLIIEDVAQGFGSSYCGHPLGEFGDIAAFSFHGTKSVISGEGGFFLARDLEVTFRAERIREKGTDRARFFRGEVDKYGWETLGSSYLPNDLTAAVLLGQLERSADIIHRRLVRWHAYYEAFKATPFCMTAPSHNVQYNGFSFHLLLPTGSRDAFRKALSQQGIGTAAHYLPLHSSPAGLKYGRQASPMPITDHVAEAIVRLPMHEGITVAAQARVIEVVLGQLEKV